MSYIVEISINDDDREVQVFKASNLKAIIQILSNHIAYTKGDSVDILGMTYGSTKVEELPSRYEE